MVTKLVCSILKATKVSNDSLPPIIFAEVRVVILIYVSPGCFQTSFIRLHVVLLEDKQNGKSGGVDRPWILPSFCHGL